MSMTMTKTRYKIGPLDEAKRENKLHAMIVKEAGNTPKGRKNIEISRKFAIIYHLTVKIVLT